jgi:FkbM family methyltransferase
VRTVGLKRRVSRLLDVPGGRPLLSWAATRQVRRLLGNDDVDVRYRGVWTHRVGRYVIPDGARFEYEAHRIVKWNDEIPKHIRNADDYWFGNYTPAAGDVIVDIGAGRGEDTLAFSQRVGATGRVIAVEAHPGSFRLLQAFCALNRLDNVTPIHAALMDAPGSVSIETGDDWRANTVSTGPAAGGATVAATTLDLLVAEHRIDQIAFVKMNIEGAERRALPGMSATLPRTRHICICCHDFRAERGDGEEYRTRAVVESFLTAHHFAVHARGDDPRPWVRDHVHAVRTS